MLFSSYYEKKIGIRIPFFAAVDNSRVPNIYLSKIEMYGKWLVAFAHLDLGKIQLDLGFIQDWNSRAFIIIAYFITFIDFFMFDGHKDNRSSGKNILPT